MPATPSTRRPRSQREPPPVLPGLEACDDPADELRRGLGPDAVIAGLDEVGRGPLAGPVVAACVVLPDGHGIEGLDDSKKLDEEAREALFPIILERASAWGVGSVESPRIDEINILQASLEAMRIAFDACEERSLAAGHRRIRGAVVDGNKRAPLPRHVEQVPVIGGDGRSTPIMAASILAKVVRDRRMMEEANRYPEYGFDLHKGYPTPVHRQALVDHGPCPLHRRSFVTVRVVCELLQSGAA